MKVYLFRPLLIYMIEVLKSEHINAGIRPCTVKPAGLLGGHHHIPYRLSPEKGNWHSAPRHTGYHCHSKKRSALVPTCYWVLEKAVYKIT